MFYVVTILHNIETGKFHPCYWRESPMPGPIKPLSEETFLRFKSAGHHTAGFDTLEQAQENIRKELLPQLELTEKRADFTPQEWNGELGMVMMAANFMPDGQFKAA